MTATRGDHVISTATFEAVRESLAHVVGGAPERFTPDTELFGSMPELDSLALVELIVVIEERFDLEMHEADITMEVFGTVGSLADHLESRATAPA